MRGVQFPIPLREGVTHWYARRKKNFFGGNGTLVVPLLRATLRNVIFVPLQSVPQFTAAMLRPLRRFAARAHPCTDRRDRRNLHSSARFARWNDTAEALA